MISTSLFTRYVRYLLERFHPIQFAFLATLIATTLISGVAAAGAPKPPLVAYIAASATLMFFLLRLRIFDEFKDHAHDKLHYPERPLPRGLLSKDELCFLLVIVFIGELFLLLWGGSWTTLLFSIALGYSLLMYREFFLRSWLRKQFTLYVVSHELLVVPFFVYIASFAVPDIHLFLTETFATLLLFSGMQLFLLEVARKMRAKEHEIASRDTYTAQYGVRGAGILVLCTAFFSIIGLALFEQLSTGSTGVLSLLGCVALLAFAAPVHTFMCTPSAANASRLFGAAIFFFAATHLGFIVYAQLYFV